MNDSALIKVDIPEPELTFEQQIILAICSHLSLIDDYDRARLIVRLARDIVRELEK